MAQSDICELHFCEPLRVAENAKIRRMEIFPVFEDIFLPLMIEIEKMEASLQPRLNSFVSSSSVSWSVSDIRLVNACLIFLELM